MNPEQTAENDAGRCPALVNGNPCEARGKHDTHWAVNMRGTRVTSPADGGDLELWAVLSYKDGDEHGWETEFRHLRETHADRLAELRESILNDGIKSPIVIGSDGRVWDGHHRLCIADELGMSTVPVTFDTSVIPPAEQDGGAE